MAPDIELSTLLPMPIQKQSESVSDFIRKSAIEIDRRQENEEEQKGNTVN